MVAVELRKLTVDFGGLRPAIEDLSLHIADGESIVVAGPSGGGKTTLLRTIAGLQAPTSGDVLFDGQLVNAVPVRERDISYIGSQGGLYRHLDVEHNLRFPLERRDLQVEQRQQQVQATSRVLRLTRLLHRKPATLSGGEQQRAALGRATTRRPRLFLFDEPLAYLEPAERQRLTEELRIMQQGMGVTTVFVTHEQRELMTMGQRLAIIASGRLEQVGPALELYRHPATTTVATFVGDPPMSLVRGQLDHRENTITIAGRVLPLPPAMRVSLLDAPRTVLIGLRPEHITIAEGERARLPLRVGLSSPMGARRQIIGDLDGRPASRVTLLVPAREPVRPGDVIEICIAVERMHVFNAATGDALHT